MGVHPRSPGNCPEPAGQAMLPGRRRGGRPGCALGRREPCLPRAGAGVPVWCMTTCLRRLRWPHCRRERASAGGGATCEWGNLRASWMAGGLTAGRARLAPARGAAAAEYIHGRPKLGSLKESIRGRAGVNSDRISIRGRLGVHLGPNRDRSEVSLGSIRGGLRRFGVGWTQVVRARRLLPRRGATRDRCRQPEALEAAKAETADTARRGAGRLAAPRCSDGAERLSQGADCAEPPGVPRAARGGRAGVGAAGTFGAPATRGACCGVGGGSNQIGPDSAPMRSRFGPG